MADDLIWDESEWHNLEIARQSLEQPGRCGDHHASGVTSCTREAGHDGAHHNGSGLTWDSPVPDEGE